jgi:hypothetical protein
MEVEYSMEELLLYKEKYDKIVAQRNTAVKKWQGNNHDKVVEYKKTYLQKNKDKFVKNSTKYNNNNKDKYKEYQANYRQTSRLRHLPFWDAEIIY